MPTYPNVLAGTRITAGLLTSMLPLTVMKPSDQSLTSNTTLANDTALVLPVSVANANYLFDCYLDYEGGTQGASDIKWQWTVPSGATLRYNAVLVGPGGGFTQNTYLAGSTVVAGTNGAGNLRGIIMTGSLDMSSTTGSLQRQWAQNSSSATPTIVHAQSSLRLVRVA